MSKKTIGLSPGTLLASEKAVSTQLNTLYYDGKQCVEKKSQSLKDIPKKIETSHTLWIQVRGLGDIEIIKALGEKFEIYLLTLEDVLNPNHRPKSEFFRTYDFVSLKYGAIKDEKIDIQQIALVRVRNIIISFQSTHDPIFKKLEQRFSEKHDRLQKHGSPYLMYALLDLLVDKYFLVQDYFEDTIEILSHQIHSDTSDKTRERLYFVREQLLSFRRSILPLTSLIDQFLQNDHYTKGATSIKIYLQDLKDHILHIQDLVRTYTETLEGLSNLYFSITADKTNKVMQTFTVVTIIFLPLTLLAGIYGMNFRHMPELDFKWAYPALLGIMLCLAILIYILFRRRKWL